MINNEAGNIFLDQPIHQTSFINPSDIIDARGSFESKEFENREYPVREAYSSINVRDFGLIGKMSPRGNIEGDSESNSEKNEILSKKIEIFIKEWAQYNKREKVNLLKNNIISDLEKFTLCFCTE